MAIATVTHGEVTSLESARAEAAAIKQEAIDGQEDAQNDKARADLAQQRDSTYATSLANERFGHGPVVAAQLLAEATALRKLAAEQRVAANERRVAIAAEIEALLNTPEGARG